jgi:NitT/TauT family transport system substrate-binding protein
MDYFMGDCKMTSTIEMYSGFRSARVGHVTRRLFWLLTVLTVTLAEFVPARAQTPAPTKLRLGIISALFDAGSLIAIEKGYFREQGLDVEVKVFPGSADANQALSIGAIDVLASGISVAIFNARLRNIDMSIVAGAGDNTPSHGIISLVLRKDLLESGRYKGPADLKGLKLATGITAPSHWLVTSLASEAHVSEKDITFVGLGIANTVAAMNNKAADGGSVNEPFATLLVEKGNGVRIASIDQKYPNFPAGYLIYGPTLTKKNVDAGNRYMIGYLKAMRDYRLAFGPKKIGMADSVAILRKYNIMVTPETPSLGVPDDCAPSFEWVNDYLDWQVKSGNIRSKPDPRSLVDDRFRLFALEALKQH